MKKTLFLFFISAAFITGMLSCKKENGHNGLIQKTIDVSLKASEQYSFTLPKNSRNDAYHIISSAKHYSLMEISENASGESIFRYIAAKGYAGKDEVIVSNDREQGQQVHQQGCQNHGGQNSNCSKQGGQHKGGCKGDDEDHFIFIINFTVEDSVNAVTK